MSTCITYIPKMLRSIKRYVTIAQNYHLTFIDNMTRCGIITLGIRRYWNEKKYWGSRRGVRIHRKIRTVVTEVENRCKLAKPVRQWDLTSIISILLENKLGRLETKESKIKCALVNCCSVVNKTADFWCDLIENNFTLCALTETWIRQENDVTLVQLCPPGFKAISISRKDSTGGGIAVVYKDTITVRSRATHNYSSMECGSFSIDLPMPTINLSVIYRPPNSSVPVFAIDFLDLLENSINENCRFLIVGDFNIPINNPDSPDTNIFQDVWDSLGLHNHITFLTLRQHNTLDLIITEHQENFIRQLNQGRLFLDHYLIDFEMAFTSTLVGQQIITFRKIKSIDCTAFAKDVQHRLATEDISKINAQECINIYHGILRTTLDNHAPLKSKVTWDRPKLPYNDEIGEAICRHCKAGKMTSPIKINFWTFIGLEDKWPICWMHQNAHIIKILHIIQKRCLKPVIHFWDGTLLFHYHLDALTMN